MDVKKMFRLFLAVAFLLPFCACNPKEEVKPQKPYLRLSTSEKTVTNQANTFTLYVESNVSWTAEAKSGWLSVDKSSGEGDAMITVGYQASTVEKRSGVIRFSTEGLNPVELVVTQTELLFTNPIGTIPDPWIVKHDGMYYTCWASGNGIKVSRSDKLSVINGAESRVWNCPKDLGDNKVWNPTNVWAPELHRVDGHWYIYYTAGRPASEAGGSYDNQRSGVLRAKTDDPLGEWEDMGMLYTGDEYVEGIVPTLDNTNYAIDLGVFYLNSQLYAVWSGVPQKNAAGPQHLYIATMENPYTISSNRVEISKPDKVWELRTGNVNEGPAFLKNTEQNKFFVIYSCNGSWTKEYCLAYVALNDTTLNPMDSRSWRKSLQPVFTRCDNRTPGVNGVGHCSFTKSPDDTEDWIVYHAKNSEQDGWSSGRSTFIKKFTWNEDGTPNFGNPVGYGEESELPSGETL